MGNHDADVFGTDLLTASSDSKVNLWNLSNRGGRLRWSNSLSEARFKTAKLSADRAVVAGSYDQDGYLQIFDRLSGDLLHEMLTLEGSGIGQVVVTTNRIVALLSIRHKLLTSKVIVMNSRNGDVLTEKTFVDVMAANVVRDRALVLLNNQTGDFRTKISVFDLQTNDVFGAENERIVFQYQHNYWKLPIHLDETSLIHTSEEKSDLYVRDFDGFFRQFDKRCASFALAENDRGPFPMSRLCRRVRQLLIKRICSKCVVM